MEIVEDAAGVTLREVIPRVIPIAAPGVGAEWAINVTAGAMWYVESLLCILTTSAVVANRNPVVTLSDGSTVFARISDAAAQAASQTIRHQWLRGYSDHVSVTSFVFCAGFPSIPLFGGFQIASLTQGLDAGDQYSGIVIYVLEVEERSYDVELGMDLATLRGSTSNAFPLIPLGS